MMFPSWFHSNLPNQKGKVLVPTWLAWETDKRPCKVSCYTLKTRHFIATCVLRARPLKERRHTHPLTSAQPRTFRGWAFMFSRFPLRVWLLLEMWGLNELHGTRNLTSHFVAILAEWAVHTCYQIVLNHPYKSVYFTTKRLRPVL